MISLQEALGEGRLEEFIQQAEAAGYGMADEGEFKKKLEHLIKAPQPEGQTSRSPASGCSPEKRTR